MITYAKTPLRAEGRSGTPSMGTDLSCHSGVCARDERARQGVLGILYPAQRERWRSTPCDTPVVAAALASIAGNTASARGKTDQVSTRNTHAEGSRRSNHVRQRLESMRTAICPAANVIIEGVVGSPFHMSSFIG